MHTVTVYELSDRLQSNTRLVWKTDTSTKCSLSSEVRVQSFACFYLNKKGQNEIDCSGLDIRHLAENSFANCLRLAPLNQDDLKHDSLWGASYHW